MHKLHHLGSAFAAFALLALPIFAAEPDLLERTLRSTSLDSDTPPGEAIVTRRFRVDPDSLSHISAVRNISLTLGPTTEAFNFLGSSGTNLFYNRIIGVLIARRTLREVDEIETLLATFSIKAPLVALEVRLVEFKPTPELAISLFRLANVLTAKTPALTILTENETRTLITALEQREGVDMRSVRKVTKLSGRQARISIEEQPTFDPPFTAPGKSPKAKWSPKIQPPKSGPE